MLKTAGRLTKSLATMFALTAFCAFAQNTLEEVKVHGTHAAFECGLNDGGGCIYVGNFPGITLPDAPLPVGQGRQEFSATSAQNGTPALSVGCSKKDTPPVNVASSAPVILSTGAKFLSATDFVHSSGLPLSLQRSYRSDDAVGPDALFGPKWRSSFDYQLTVEADTCSNSSCSPSIMSFKTPDGNVQRLYRFIPPSPQTPYHLYMSPARIGDWNNSAEGPYSGGIRGQFWLAEKKMTIQIGEIYYNFYSANGVSNFKIASIQGASGATIYSFTRNAAGKIISIKNYSGQQITIGWDSANIHAVSVTAPNGKTWQYEYGPAGMLTQIIPPADAGGIGNFKYHYEDGDATRLTGYSVGSSRISDYRYFADGKVRSSAFLDGSIVDSFEYGSDAGAPYTIKTDVAGGRTLYRFTLVSGQPFLSSVTVDGSAYCPNMASSQTYDSNGLLNSSKDPNGNTSLYKFNKDGLLL